MLLLLFFSLSFQLQFLNFRPLTQNVLSTNKASNRKMCNNGFNIMTAFVCLQCLGAVTSDFFFVIQLVFQFSCKRKRPNFPLLDPLKRPCSKTYIGCWLSTGHSFAASVALRKPYKRQLLYFRGCYRSRFVQLSVSIFSGSNGNTSIQITRRMLILTLPD